VQSVGFTPVYDDYFDDPITNAFKQAGCKSYMKLHDATGESQTSGARLGTHKSPGRDKSILMAVPDENIPRLLEIVRGLKAEHPNVGFRSVTFPLEECIL
jgi:hypothetical protein